MSDRIKISIITVAKNSAGTISDPILSVLSQDYPSEHILVDGCSSDDTLEIMRRHATEATKILSEPDKNHFDAMNKGLAMATGDVVAILNSDDYYAHAGVLSRIAREFETTGAESCYADLVYVDAANTSRVIRYWRSGTYHRQRFYSGWMPPHPTFFAKRQLYEKYGGFNLDLGLSADYELMLRFLFKHGVSSRYIPEVLTVMRSGGQGNASLGNRLRAHRLDRLAWDINGLKPKPWTLIAKPLSKVYQYVMPNLRIGTERFEWGTGAFG
ncbi:MAG: glycosyltransferase family 2 protein [Pseudomonadota bacterium]